MPIELDQQCINTIRFLSVEKKLESSPDGCTPVGVERMKMKMKIKPDEFRVKPGARALVSG